MTASFHGKTATIVYNGEIYNTEELRNNLSSYSLRWNTKCDTEVILNGYLAMGTAFFSRLNGIFAFSIYDHMSGEMLLARDPLGVKPLFYQEHQDTVIFASEPKAIFAYGVPAEADRECWNEIFTLGPARTPGKGGFKNMKEVLPGECLTFSAAPNAPYYNCQKQFFWSLEAHPHRDSYSDTVEKVKWLIEDSIRRQMV